MPGSMNDLEENCDVSEIVDIDKLEYLASKGNKKAGARAAMLKKAKEILENFRRRIAEEEKEQEQGRPPVTKPLKPRI